MTVGQLKQFIEDAKVPDSAKLAMPVRHSSDYGELDCRYAVGETAERVVDIATFNSCTAGEKSRLGQLLVFVFVL